MNAPKILLLAALLAPVGGGCDDSFRRNRGGDPLDLSSGAARDLARLVDDGGADPGSDAAGPKSDGAAPGTDLTVARDLAPIADLRLPDLLPLADLTPPRDLVMAPLGAVTGGPCSSGAPGATGLRLGWVDGGGRATMQYEVQGMPDKGNVKAGVYGYQFGFTPMFVDPFLGAGGLQLDGSSFIDINLSTVGIKAIKSATLSIFGRSYNVGASGSFTWQTAKGVGATPPNSVSNAAPYKWYSGDISAVLSPNDQGILLRVKAGPNSGSLVVRRLELCFEAT